MHSLMHPYIARIVPQYKNFSCLYVEHFSNMNYLKELFGSPSNTFLYPKMFDPLLAVLALTPPKTFLSTSRLAVD